MSDNTKNPPPPPPSEPIAPPSMVRKNSKDTNTEKRSSE